MKCLRLICALTISAFQAPSLLAGPSNKVSSEHHLGPEVALEELQQIVTAKQALILDCNSS